MQLVLDDLDVANNWSRSSQRYTHLDATPMQIRVAAGSHEHGAVGRARWCTRTAVEYHVDEFDVYNLVLRPGDPPTTVNATPVEAGSIVFASAGSEGVTVGGRGLDYLEILVAPDPTTMPTRLWKPRPHAFRRLVHLTRHGMHLNRHDPATRSSYQRSLDDALHCARPDRDEAQPSRHDAEAVVRRALEALIDDDRQPMDELAAHCGTSRATLYRCFDRLLGISPYRFVQLRRLSRIRSRLLETAPEPGRISAIAAEVGAHHLGDLARAYADVFGELPSHTVAPRRLQPTESVRPA